MSKASNSVATIFSRALEVPPGQAREALLNHLCNGDLPLRQEVVCLLQAHERAGGFLQTHPSTQSTQPSQSAAGHAAEFLKTVADSSAPEILVDEYIAGLAREVRQETQERIKAGLRVKSMRTSSQAKQPPAEPENPSFPGYRVERKLGAGGMGIVYVAQDEKLNRRVALKVLKQDADERLRRRILDEARHTAALHDPAVVTVYSVMDDATPPAIVMEYVEGYPLDRFAAQLNHKQKARLLREVARGLSVAHSAGLIHRDLKPENVIVGPELQPRILDFGLSLSLEEAGWQGRGFEGTPLFASPEQVLGRSLTPASDVFSFGSLMFKVLTGRAPFAGNTVAEVLEAISTSPPPFLNEAAVGIPEELQAICLACLAWNPEDRPTASEAALELGRFIAGEPVRLKPKLYGDLLRQNISEYSSRVRDWESQSIISREERDALEVMHRRLLADEDHWLIDARRITPFQTVLSAGTWLTVVAILLTVWMLRDDLGPLFRWLLPLAFTLALLGAGVVAQIKREPLAAATFLAGAVLALAPCILSLLYELGLFQTPAQGVTQLFDKLFTNQQVALSSFVALAASVYCLWQLQMTGFAWTTAALGATTYISLLLLFNWLDRKPEIQALWCLPLAWIEAVALILEKRGRVRWTLPFHLVALIVIVGGLDIMALNGPTLQMLGLAPGSFLDETRLKSFSFALNGLLFLGLMYATEKSSSLDLRRASKLLEILAIVHTLSALFTNALDHRDQPYVRMDVALYLAAALAFAILAPFHSRWRMLVGGLIGCGMGSYLLVDLGLVARKPFILCLGFSGLAIALGAFVYTRRKMKS